MDKQLIDIAHEIWAAAQLAPSEGIEDGISRIAAILARIDAELGKLMVVSEMVRTAPERIWLQVSDEPADIDDPFPRPITDEMTWSTGQCVACEVEYVRADLSPTPAIPENMVLVPVIPTPAMCAVISNEHDIYGSAQELYAMVLQAAQGERNEK